MPLLAALLGTAFSAVVTFLTTYISKKLAVAVAMGAFLAAGWVAINGAMQLLYDGIAWSAPAWMVGPLSIVAYLVPSNFGPAVLACEAALYARFLWDAQREWARSITVA